MLAESTGRKTKIKRFSNRVVLEDGAATNIHVVKYERSTCVPKLITFKQPERLLDWCEANESPEALNGGFFLWDEGLVLGDLWLAGEKQKSVAVKSPWDKLRGAMHIDENGFVAIGPRHTLPEDKVYHLMQAGPVLIKDGAVQIIDTDPEGMSSGASQFDSDITDGRYPRSAIGVCDDFIWSVVCDGRSDVDSGMTLQELALCLQELGVKHALNLDGGGSSTQISEMRMRNKSVSVEEVLERGRPVYSAIIFEIANLDILTQTC